MIKLRSIIYFILLALSIVFYGLPIVLVGWMLPVNTRNHAANHWAAMNMWLLKTICGLDYRVQGKDNLPQNAAIVMSKHQSAWETMSLRTIVGGRQSWILKRELMWVPIFGWAMAFMQPIAINRKAGRKSVDQIVTQGTHYLEQGNFVIVFPEGTRTAPGSKGRYKLGGAILAQQSGYPVVPIAHNAGNFWRRRDINKYPGMIDVVVGPAIHTEGRKAEEIIKDVEGWIETTMESLPQAREES